MLVCCVVVKEYFGLGNLYLILAKRYKSDGLGNIYRKEVFWLMVLQGVHEARWWHLLLVRASGS